MSSFKIIIKTLKRIPTILTNLEKAVLLVVLMVIIGTSGLWWQSLAKFWEVKPIKGGTYIEGITTQNPFDTETVIAKLTKIGLTYINHNGEIKGALAEKWEISPDGKTYTFNLRPGIDASKIAEIYSILPSWQNIAVSAPDNSTIEFSLKQAFSPLLSFTSNPDIDQGPYIIEKQVKNEITFTANENFVLGEPNVQRIILIFYHDQKLLKPALQRQEIMGADVLVNGISGIVNKKMELTKQTVVVFNQDNPLMRDIKLREQIRDNHRIENSPELTLVTSQDPILLEKANEFINRLNGNGWKIKLKSLNPIALERDSLANDNYDLLLTELNYGYDEDPYPYWHSSQIIAPGKNYAAYNSKEADKLIEESRQILADNERKKKYEEFQKILNRDVAAIFYPKEVYRYSVSNRIRGIKEGTGAVAADRFTEVWTWFIKAKKER